jgi:hypothetical protein
VELCVVEEINRHKLATLARRLAGLRFEQAAVVR